MGSLRTHILTLAATLTLAGLALPARALPPTATERLYVFAQCAGRMSAALEHGWLVQDADTDRQAAERQTMVTLYETTLPYTDVPPPVALHWRIEAKMAQAVLLQRASFSSEPRLAQAAAQMSDTYLAGCRALLLG